MNLKKEINIFGKSIPAFVIALIAISVLGSAALLGYYGNITGTADVSQSVVLDGNSYDTPSSFSFSPVDAGETVIEKHWLRNNGGAAETVDFKTVCDTGEAITDPHSGPTTQRNIDWGSQCKGIDTRYVEYFDNAGASLPTWNGPSETCDVTVSTLDNLNGNVSDETTGEVICIDSDITLTSDLEITDADEVITSKTSARQKINFASSYSEDKVDVRSGLNIHADGVTIKGLKIEGDSDSNTDDYGIRLQGSRSGVTVKNNVIDVGWEAVELENSDTHHSTILIEDNDLSAYIPVMAFDTDSSTIRNNKLHDGDYGVVFSPTDDAGVPDGNVIQSNTFDSIAITDIYILAKNTEIKDNDITGGGDNGITVLDKAEAYSTGTLSVPGNKINQNNIDGHAEYGVATGYTDGSYGFHQSSINTGSDVDAHNNWWGTDGISTSGNVDATWMTKSDMELDQGETDHFGVINDFAINLKPSKYTLEMEVVPA